MRGPIDSKSNTCTESLYVDAAGQSSEGRVLWATNDGDASHVTAFTRCHLRRADGRRSASSLIV